MKKSRSGRWRAYSLTIVHLLMIGHIMHWLWAGNTLTPIEPSESMETISRGEINMGFLFFALALIATLILGRWVCGWGCHLVAYQDLTLWVLKKLRMRPKPFRTRFLFFIPLLAAIYMFVLPLIDRLWLAYHGSSPQWSWHLTRTGFWDTFPGPLFAILTFLVCGVLMIYFLGPKGFCTFACPYGGFFALTDKLATARIRVTDACQQCGHCTAVCTSNVNVAQEVNLYKMVVDPGCMKCLDCVSVCPNDALYVGFGRPALGAKPVNPPKPRRFDMTLGEELAALAIFAGTLLSVRGLYGEFPFLMSLGIAGVMTYLVIKAAQLFYARDVIIQKLRLKTVGKIRPLGFGYLIVVSALVLLTIHSGVWSYHDYRAYLAFNRSPSEAMSWQYDPSFVETATAEQLEHVAAGVRHAEFCDDWGFFADPGNHLPLAWLYLFTDDRKIAADRVRLALATHPDKPMWWLMLARVETSLGHPEEAREAYEKAIAIDTPEREALLEKLGSTPLPQSSMIWQEWGTFLSHRGQPEAAANALKNAIEYDPNSIRARIAMFDFHVRSKNVDAARQTLLDAIRLKPHGHEVRAALARLRQLPQDANQAIADYRAALKEFPDNVPLLHNLAYTLTQLQRFDEAHTFYRKAVELSPNSLEIRADLGAVLLARGDLPGAVREYEYIVQKEPKNADAALRLGFLYVETGRADDGIRSIKVALEHGNEIQRQQAQLWLQQIEQQRRGSTP